MFLKKNQPFRALHLFNNTVKKLKKRLKSIENRGQTDYLSVKTGVHSSYTWLFSISLSSYLHTIISVHMFVDWPIFHVKKFV